MGTTVEINSKRIARLAGSFLLLGIFLAVCGCGSPGAGTVTAVTVSPTSSTLTYGTLNNQTEFFATVTITGQTSTTTNATSTAVTWYVNGVSGGNTTYGTITVDPNNPQGGIYTAPKTIPSSTTCGVSGQMCITATAQRNPNGNAGTANTLVTSNQAILTLSAARGIQIVSPPSTVPAGGSAQFTANFNGQADPTATWAVSSSNGGNFGSIIANSGVYSAPTIPPPGDVVTITASDSGVSATTTVQIIYSDLALDGHFAFAYTGNDTQGYLAAAGSFFADGNGDILSGVEDVSSFLSGVSPAPLSIASTSSYKVGPDGRGTITLDTTRGVQTFAFVLSANTHGLITRFDSSTGSGTMERQGLAALGGSNSTIAGPYVFSALGDDKSFNPEAMAGEFSAVGGTISAANSVLDIHDGASSSATITTNSNLTADSGYSFDTNNLGTGRGTLTLNTPAGSLDFAFYVIDSTELYLVEIDGKQAYLAGTMFSANAASTGLPGPNYVFTAGGSAPFSVTNAGQTTTTIGAYAVGGVFVSNGAGSISSGTLDVNNQGNVPASAALASCGYTVNGANGRIDLKLFTGTSGSCPNGAAANVSEFAMYPYETDQTDQPGSGFLLVEIDPNAATSGVAYAQSSAASLTSGGFALGLAGQGVAHGTRATPTTAAQNVDGEFSTLLGGAGELDVNFFNPLAASPVSSAAFGGASSTGRGTLTIVGRSLVTYNLIYYVVDTGEALLLDVDNDKPSFVLLGSVQRQF